MNSILLVEDDVSLGQTLQERLAKNYSVKWVKTVAQALEAVAEVRPDLVILDIGLPDGDGFAIANVLQKTGISKFMFLTAQADAETRLQGFELGALEFVPKPFHLKELLMRVEHIFENHSSRSEVQIEGFKIDFQSQSITRPDGTIEYPPATDMKLLQLLIEKSPAPVARDVIMNTVWGEDKYPNIRTIDNTVVRLRSILGQVGDSYIRSVRGVGYQWAKGE